MQAACALRAQQGREESLEHQSDTSGCANRKPVFAGNNIARLKHQFARAEFGPLDLLEVEKWFDAQLKLGLVVIKKR